MPSIANLAARQACVLFALAVVASIAGCRSRGMPEVPPGYREFAYVANTGSNTVSVLDLVYLRVDRTLAVGEAPVALAVNPVRTEVYAVNRGSASVSVIDAATNALTATIPVHRLPSAIVVSSDGRRAFVANAGSNSVSVVDLDAHRELASAATAASPSALALAPDGRTLVVSNRGAGSLSIFAVAPVSLTAADRQLELRATISGCPGAASVVILPDSSKTFVACSGAHQVMAVSLAAAPSSWAAKGNPTLLRDHLLALLDVGQSPSSLALKPDGGEIFVLNAGSDSISEIATGTNEVGGTYTIVSHPMHAIASDNSTLWISNLAADSIATYSIDDGRLTGSVRTGSGPDAIAFSDDQHLLLAANTRSGDVAVIRTDTQQGPALFTMLPAGMRPAAIVTKSFRTSR